MIISNPIRFAVENLNSNVGLPAAVTIHLTLPTHLICRMISVAAKALGNLIASPFSTGGLEHSWSYTKDAAFNLKVALYALFAPFRAASLLPEGIQAKELADLAASRKNELEMSLKNLARERFTKLGDALLDSLPENIEQSDLDTALSSYDKLTENPLDNPADVEKLKSDFEALKTLIENLVEQYPQEDSDGTTEEEELPRSSSHDGTPPSSPGFFGTLFGRSPA